ncbi:MAG TPA: hypothetical protein VGH27_24440 [Streptosporangiaceae bacterium]|jgi:hypothetical protein
MRDDDLFGNWRHSLLDALDSPDKVMAWQDRRYRFAFQVGQLLTGASAPDIPPVTDHVVYGIHVAGGGLLYIGQTGDAKRRLRDLPVGESHHLAATVPPEIWERVIVIQWPSLLSRISRQEAKAATEMGPTRCGLAMEYLLQATYRPVMNARRRSTAGGWSARRIESSHSRGAVSSTQLPELFDAVRAQWDALSRVHPDENGSPIFYSDAGRAVFPGSL